MNKKAEKTVMHSGHEWTDHIKEMIDAHLPSDCQCPISKESLLKDIKFNMFLQNSPTMVFILDFINKEYLFLSENTKQELEINSRQLLEKGFDLALSTFDENHKNILINEILPTTLETYAKYALTNEAKDILVRYNTLVRTKGGNYQWFYHQMSVLACDEKGFPKYTIKLLTNINEYKKDENVNFTIHKKVENKPLELIYSKDFMPHEIDASLSEREKEILKLVSDGYSTKMIADKLFISMNTVSTHRKNFLRKLKK